MEKTHQRRRRIGRGVNLTEIPTGSVSHAQALEKATAEYRKHQNDTLSAVEEAYLETLKATEKLVKKNTKGKKS